MSDARPRSVSRQGSFDNQLHMNLDFIEPGTHELPSTPAPSSRCMEDIAGYIFTSNGSQDDLKVLDGLLYGVADINAFVMAKIGGKIAGLYGEVYLNQIIYSIKKNEGSAATLVHYAAINGNTDILNLLIKHGCYLYAVAPDNKQRMVSPGKVALTNGHYMFCKLLDSQSRTSTSICTLS